MGRVSESWGAWPDEVCCEEGGDKGCCCAWSDPLLETVGVTGDWVSFSLTGDDGESKSRELDESFVLFFFKKPNVGIDIASGIRLSCPA